MFGFFSLPLTNSHFYYTSCEFWSGHCRALWWKAFCVASCVLCFCWRLEGSAEDEELPGCVHQTLSPAPQASGSWTGWGGFAPKNGHSSSFAAKDNAAGVEHWCRKTNVRIPISEKWPSFCHCPWGSLFLFPQFGLSGTFRGKMNGGRGICERV